jgi:L-lactate dehydrogenase complex protein LldG
MTEKRGQILSAIRRSLRAAEGDATRRRAVEDRLASHPRGIVPARGQGDEAARVALFRQMAEKVQTSFSEVASLEEVPRAVADYLKEHNLPPRAKIAPSPDLKDLDWDGQKLLEAAFGKAEEPDPTAVTRAFAGVAETGTLVMASGPESPVTLSFLPETNIVVLRREEVLGAYEEAFERLRAKLGEARMPRTLNMITGPSRTADIEQKIELGAHGPKRLHVILVGAPAGEGA